MPNKNAVAKRGAPADGAPLVDLHEVARMAGVGYHSYLRSVRTNKKHPQPVSSGRRQLFRRSEVMDFLGVPEQLDLDLQPNQKD